MKKLKITLKRSLICCLPKQKATIEALGLRKKIGTISLHDDTPQIRGMIEKVKHLVAVEEIDA